MQEKRSFTCLPEIKSKEGGSLNIKDGSVTIGGGGVPNTNTLNTASSKVQT